ncbi:glucan 1,4-alpha-glucosidase [bacterium]|nr:glucan 1,4-alpha-glucosidase [bacterium]
MADLERSRPAPGGPGIEPRWTPSAKDGIGTAYSSESRVWFTTAAGIVTEVYYPTIDRPQVRDLQLLVTDGSTFFHDERDDLETEVDEIDPYALGLKITNVDRHGHYRIVKELIADPHASCLLMHVRLERTPSYTGPLRVFALLAPHLEVGGWGNDAHAAVCSGREILTANKGGTWLAFGATVPFLARSCGYVGTSDGWQQLKRTFELGELFDSAENGNVALTGELDLGKTQELTIGVAFGDCLHQAATTLFQSLAVPYSEHRKKFIEQWQRSAKRLLPLEKHSGDGGHLYRRSHGLLTAHEDKTYPGALIASLSIPWGEDKGDEELGGYHLVWTRDLVNSASGLLAAGNASTPLRALIYLACTQRSDGGFPQNFWIDGEPYWTGIQLDEVAFPIMLAHRLDCEGALRDFDPYSLVLRAAGYLVREGPATPQERWEECGGHSPSTLASNIAALVCAGIFARERGDPATARFLEEYADFLEAHIDVWTVTNAGTLVPGIRRHFVRISPIDVTDPLADEDPDRGTLKLKNRAPGERDEFPAREIVDAGFLELVRYGVRKPGDPLVEDSLRVVDAVLKVETPLGPAWRRYNNDGYGQRADGGPYRHFGVGRAWPLLTGERGHYEFAAGRDARSYVRALERFATRGSLLPEQVWDEPDRPAWKMFLGKPTGAAMPLMWAQAEYVKLLRTLADGRVFDLIPAVAHRYEKKRAGPSRLKVWKFNRHARKVAPGAVLRVLAAAPFRLHWTLGEESQARDTASSSTAIGVDFVDIPIGKDQRAPVRFTFFWTDAGRWEGRDFQVQVDERAV